MPLKVIGAGQSRTGTNSLKQALEIIGFGPCCHMDEMLKPENHWRWKLWERYWDGEAIDWNEVFSGFASTVDGPGNIFYEALARAYPDAKVILSVREPQSWLRSITANFAVLQESAQQTGNWIFALMPRAKSAARRQGVLLTDPAEPDAAKAIDAFNRYNEQVKRTVAPDRLLVFDVKQGWEPLCAFLGAAVPGTPFPHTNSSEDFQRLVKSRDQTQH